MRRWLAGLILTGVLACQSSASTGAHTSFPAPAQRAAPAAKSDSRVQEPPNLPVGYQDQTSPSIDDAGDSDTHYSLAGETRVHPLDGKTEADLEQMLSSHPDALGSMSIGSPSGGTLLNSVALDSANGIEVVDPAHAWGTQETVDFVKACVAVVRAQFPNTPTLYVGHLSARNGGPLAPHLSHQSGRDVDSGYYYLDGARWYAPATAENLDAPRTWALIRALTGESDVEMILIDRSVQPILRQYALRAGEPSEWVEELFQGVPGKVPPLIRHAAGHRTHMHIRFYNPIAQETGRRLYPLLLKQRLLDPPVYFVRHRAKRGETLARIARRYGTSVEAIVRANNLRSTRIREGHDYRIPRAGPVRWVSRQLEFPPRRRPPKHASIPDQLTAK